MVYPRRRRVVRRFPLLQQLPQKRRNVVVLVVILLALLMLSILYYLLLACTSYAADKSPSLLRVSAKKLDDNGPIVDAVATFRAAGVQKKARQNRNHQNGNAKEEEPFQIIVLTMNRHASLQRLFDSLLQAGYDGDQLDLTIRIDHDDDNKNNHADGSNSNTACVKLAQDLVWPHGTKTMDVATTNRGLALQWFQAWVPRTDTSRAIILEDDIQLSTAWYTFVRDAWRAYGNNNNNDVAGVSLQRQTLIPSKDEQPSLVDRLTSRWHAWRGTRVAMVTPSSLVYDHEGVYLYSLVGSIGFSPHPIHWRTFTSWVMATTEHDFANMHVEVPGLVTTQWWQEGNKRQMWTQHFIYYCWKHDLYTLYVNLPTSSSSWSLPWSSTLTLATHWRDQGEHSNYNMGQDFYPYMASSHIRPALDWPLHPVKYGWNGRPVMTTTAMAAA